MILRIHDFEHWRIVARRLISQNVRPHEVTLREFDDQPLLFDQVEEDHSFNVSAIGSQMEEQDSAAERPFTVPRAFLSLAQEVAYHRDETRWGLLYRSLWRLVREQPNLLEFATDDDVYRLRRMEQQVRRDAHKTKAFVRFRRVTRDEQEHFIAWHRPDHYILRRVAPFFSRRFKAMNWSILTPYESVSWDQKDLHFGPGVPRSEAPQSDELETLWRTYYASIFNPARVKVKAMKSEMPVRFWETLPEAELIPDLLSSAAGRVEGMIADREGYQQSAADVIVEFQQHEQREIESLAELAQVASKCAACDLHCHATQTVFGEGPESARIVIVGEQPGDHEDLAGRPFVGPAGRVLDEVLAAATVDRRDVYVTNVVKHFKFTTTATGDSTEREPRGKRRLHKRPDAQEVRVCKPWFTAEWGLLKQASVLVCLGSTAATALIQPGFKISRERGRLVESQYCQQTIATWHPSAILRTPDRRQKALKIEQMIEDLRLARRLSQ